MMQFGQGGQQVCTEVHVRTEVVHTVDRFGRPYRTQFSRSSSSSTVQRSYTMATPRLSHPHTSLRPPFFQPNFSNSNPPPPPPPSTIPMHQHCNDCHSRDPSYHSSRAPSNEAFRSMPPLVLPPPPPPPPPSLPLNLPPNLIPMSSNFASTAFQSASPTFIPQCSNSMSHPKNKSKLPTGQLSTMAHKPTPLATSANIAELERMANRQLSTALSATNTTVSKHDQSAAYHPYHLPSSSSHFPHHFPSSSSSSLPSSHFPHHLPSYPSLSLLKDDLTYAFDYDKRKRIPLYKQRVEKFPVYTGQTIAQQLEDEYIDNDDDDEYEQGQLRSMLPNVPSNAIVSANVPSSKQPSPHQYPNPIVLPPTAIQMDLRKNTPRQKGQLFRVGKKQLLPSVSKEAYERDLRAISVEQNPCYTSIISQPSASPSTKSDVNLRLHQQLNPLLLSSSPPSSATLAHSTSHDSLPTSSSSSLLSSPEYLDPSNKNSDFCPTSSALQHRQYSESAPNSVLLANQPMALDLSRVDRPGDTPSPQQQPISELYRLLQTNTSSNVPPAALVPQKRKRGRPPKTYGQNVYSKKQKTASSKSPGRPSKWTKILTEEQQQQQQRQRTTSIAVDAELESMLELEKEHKLGLINYLLQTGISKEMIKNNLKHLSTFLYAMQNESEELFADSNILYNAFLAQCAVKHVQLMALIARFVSSTGMEQQQQEICNSTAGTVLCKTPLPSNESSPARVISTDGEGGSSEEDDVEYNQKASLSIVNDENNNNNTSNSAMAKTTITTATITEATKQFSEASNYIDSATKPELQNGKEEVKDEVAQTVQCSNSGPSQPRATIRTRLHFQPLMMKQKPVKLTNHWPQSKPPSLAMLAMAKLIEETDKEKESGNEESVATETNQPSNSTKSTDLLHQTSNISVTVSKEDGSNENGYVAHECVKEMLDELDRVVDDETELYAYGPSLPAIGEEIEENFANSNDNDESAENMIMKTNFATTSPDRQSHDSGVELLEESASFSPLHCESNLHEDGDILCSPNSNSSVANELLEVINKVENAPEMVEESVSGDKQPINAESATNPDDESSQSVKLSKEFSCIIEEDGKQSISKKYSTSEIMNRQKMFVNVIPPEAIIEESVEEIQFDDSNNLGLNLDGFDVNDEQIEETTEKNDDMSYEDEYETHDSSGGDGQDSDNELDRIEEMILKEKSNLKSSEAWTESAEPKAVLEELSMTISKNEAASPQAVLLQSEKQTETMVLDWENSLVQNQEIQRNQKFQSDHGAVEQEENVNDDAATEIDELDYVDLYEEVIEDVLKNENNKPKEVEVKVKQEPEVVNEEDEKAELDESMFKMLCQCTECCKLYDERDECSDPPKMVRLAHRSKICFNRNCYRQTGPLYTCTNCNHSFHKTCIPRQRCQNSAAIDGETQTLHSCPLCHTLGARWTERTSTLQYQIEVNHYPKAILDALYVCHLALRNKYNNCSVQRVNIKWLEDFELLARKFPPRQVAKVQRRIDLAQIMAKAERDQYRLKEEVMIDLDTMWNNLCQLYNVFDLKAQLTQSKKSTLSQRLIPNFPVHLTMPLIFKAAHYFIQIVEANLSHMAMCIDCYMLTYSDGGGDAQSAALVQGLDLEQVVVQVCNEPHRAVAFRRCFKLTDSPTSYVELWWPCKMMRSPDMPHSSQVVLTFFGDPELDIKNIQKANLRDCYVLDEATKPQLDERGKLLKTTPCFLAKRLNEQQHSSPSPVHISKKVLKEQRCLAKRYQLAFDQLKQYLENYDLYYRYEGPRNVLPRTSTGRGRYRRPCRITTYVDEANRIMGFREQCYYMLPGELREEANKPFEQCEEASKRAWADAIARHNWWNEIVARRHQPTNEPCFAMSQR